MTPVAIHLEQSVCVSIIRVFQHRVGNTKLKATLLTMSGVSFLDFQSVIYPNSFIGPIKIIIMPWVIMVLLQLVKSLYSGTEIGHAALIVLKFAISKINYFCWFNKLGNHARLVNKKCHRARILPSVSQRKLRVRTVVDCPISGSYVNDTVVKNCS